SNERILCSRGTSGSSFPVAGLIRASVSASHEMAERDRAGQRYGVDPAVLGGIVSRESRGGTGLNECETLDQGLKWHNYNHDYLLSCCVYVQPIVFMFNLLCVCFSWALAAYNMGAGSISSYEQVDAKTTGGNYANDVVARAEYLKKTWLLKVSQAD
uniref:Lysozyme n=1 Tax=Oncorhynchus kisutch TaxID=8019 RepID=A0A8C7IVZ4_ONCKI